MFSRVAERVPVQALRGRQSSSRLLFARRCLSLDSRLVKVSNEVQEAVHANKPVVALETTIYTHGYPYPQNVALASELESIVRVNGGVPATIGIIDGVAKVGLSPEELIELSASAGKETTLKLSRRDLSYVLGTRLAGKRLNGGTTIAGTMILAHLAGIRVFATGGLGGVHRGAESSMDISADLTELGRTPVAVISSGCKSFLDIPRTLEYLETEGVTVGTFSDGRSGKVDFPAFWSRDSGVRSPLTIADEKEAAAIIYAHLNLPLHSGLHFANPVPEAESIPKDEMDVFIQEAIKQADAAGASGNDNTPFILSKIKELSNGRSLSANRALICSNVRRGTIVAKELVALEKEMKGHRDMLTAFVQPRLPFATNAVAKDGSVSKGGVSGESEPVEMDDLDTSDRIIESRGPKPLVSDQITHSSSQNLEPNSDNISKAPDVVVAGALACDYSCDYAPIESTNRQPLSHTSNPAIIKQSIGGVAHNVAKAAHYLGTSTKLFSLVGDDLDGWSARNQLISEGMQVDGIEVCSHRTARTARYVAINDGKKDLVTAMADMELLNDHGTAYLQSSWAKQIEEQKPRWFVADANWEPHLLHKLFTMASDAGSYTAFEPVSIAKGSRLFKRVHDPTDTSSGELKELDVYPKNHIDMMTPNAMELAAMHSTARDSGLLESEKWWKVIDEMGIPSTGIRSRLVEATSAEIVDQGIPQQMIQLLPFVPCIITKLGPQGILLALLLETGDPRVSSPEAAPFIISRSKGVETESGVSGIYMRYYPSVAVLNEDEILSVNGVGDTFLGALVAALQRTGKGVEDLINFAQQAAVLSLRSRESVSPELRQLSLELERLSKVTGAQESLHQLTKA